MKEPSGESFEERMKADTFSDLEKKIALLTDKGRYSEARREISNELNLFARSLSDAGTLEERRKRLRVEFEASLPESLQIILDSKDATPAEDDEEKMENGESIANVIQYWEEKGWEYLGAYDPEYDPSEEEKNAKHLRVIDTGRRKLVFQFNNKDDDK
jgi:hypothetical protein